MNRRRVTFAAALALACAALTWAWRKPLADRPVTNDLPDNWTWSR